MGAYFDLYKGMPTFTKAKAICEKYFDYPIVSWRSLFIEIANQLAELEGETAEKKVSKKVEETQGDSEILKGTMIDSAVEADYANITEIKVELFEVDLEVLFSLYPFRTNEYDQLIFSHPHHVLTVKTDKSSLMRHTSIALPEAFAKKNLLVKISTSTNTCKSVLVYSFNKLSVTVSQESGRLKVANKETNQFPQQSICQGLCQEL